MAVLVKPNGALGVAYPAAIAPFRHLAVYPLMMRGIGTRAPAARLARARVAAAELDSSSCPVAAPRSGQAGAG